MIRKRILRGKKYSDLSLSSRQAVDRIVARRRVAIGRIAKRIEPKLRRSEASRKSGGGYKSISLSSQPKKKLKEELSRDNLIQVVTEMFSQIAEEMRIPLSGAEMATLRRKCNESNNSFQTLRTVFDRGVASWYTGLREDSTPQQWGFARVNSFIANGRTRFTADRDLMEAEDKHATLATIKDKETSSKSLVGFLKNSDPEISKAADDELKKRRDAGQTDAGQLLDKHYDENPEANPDNPPAEPKPTPQVKTPQYSSGLATGLADILDKKVDKVDDQTDTTDEPAEEESSVRAKQIVSRKKELTDKRKSVKPKNEKSKEEAKSIDEELKQLEIEHRALGISGKMTNEKYAEQREKYDRESAPTVLPEHNSSWNKSLAIDGETTSNLRSSTPEKVPGNAASAMNEAASGLGATQIINQKLNLNSKKARSRMAVYTAKLVLDESGNVIPGSYFDQIGVTDKSKPVSLPDGVSKSDLKNFRELITTGPEIRKGIKNSEIVDRLDDKQILAMYTATNMMHAKASVINAGIEKLGWKDDEISSVSYTGSKTQLSAVTENLKRIKQEQLDSGVKSPYVVNQLGQKVDIDKAIELAETTGGGENPSDTTILTRNNKTGEVMFLQTSDKSNPKDQLGNTTVSAQFDDWELTLRAKQKAGDISQEQLDTAIKVLDDTRKTVKASENLLANERYAYSSNLIDLMKNEKGGANALLEKFKELSGSKGDTKYLDAFMKHPEAKGTNDYEKIQNVLEYMNKSVSSGDEAALKTFNATHQEAMKRLSDSNRWRGSGPKPQAPSLEESNRHVSTIVNSQTSLANSLDDIHPKLGTHCAAYELMHRGHLTQHLKGALGADGDPATHGCFSLILGDYSPTSEMYQEAMGVDNVKDFLDGFSTTPVELTETKGRATGGSNIYASQKHFVDDAEIGSTNYDDDQDNAGTNKAVSKIYKQYTRTRGGSNWGASMTHSDELLRMFRKTAGYPAFSTKYDGELVERFYNFLEFVNESADKAVGNVPVISQKPIHHKASGHKYHIHHMINPDIALKHQVKHATQRFDRDVDSDIDQFDKPKANFPDEVSVPTKDSTARFFAKYKKEREHIHAGEPIDEKTITPKYTGDENSWYHDASGQKVRVFSQADLKYPEDVDKFIKNPTRQKDVGSVMSMKDFLKTQPEKKK